MDIEEYIKKQLDFSGGACWGINTFGLAKVYYCFKEHKYKIFFVNIKLFMRWILKKY